jgi:hypothetical protein
MERLGSTNILDIDYIRIVCRVSFYIYQLEVKALNTNILNQQRLSKKTLLEKNPTKRCRLNHLITTKEIKAFYKVNGYRTDKFYSNR